VVTAKIVAGAVTGLQIRDASVGNSDLGNDSVTGSRIRGGAVSNTDLANDAVTTGKLRAASVGNSDLADGSVSGSKVADSSLTGADIRDGEVVEGNGRILGNAVMVPDGAGATTILSAPGLGALRASCAAGVATTSWQNTTSVAISVVNDVAFHRTTAPAAAADIDSVHAATPGPGAVVEQPANLGVGGAETVTWQAAIDDAGGDRVATVWVAASSSGNNCRISAQGISTA
jgi:hypothetical protein